MSTTCATYPPKGDGILDIDCWSIDDNITVRLIRRPLPDDDNIIGVWMVNANDYLTPDVARALVEVADEVDAMVDYGAIGVAP
jgi:hypothetical protein